MTTTLILLRHGQSEANERGLFTGLIDSPLTELGLAEAYWAAKLLKDANFFPQRYFSSPLVRASDTANIVASDLGFTGEITFDWRLAERNYGALSGRTKHEVYTEAGPELFKLWRRSVNTAPPQMSPSHRASLGNLPAFLGHSESLADVCVRVEEFLGEFLSSEQPTTLVVAHGNSLRALCMILDQLSDSEVEDLNLPTGQPLIYQLDEAGHSLTRGGSYLDAARAEAAARLIAEQGGT